VAPGAALLLASGGALAESGPAPLEIRWLERAPTTGSFLRLTDGALAYEPAQGGAPSEASLEDLREIHFRSAAAPAAPADRLRVTLVSGEEVVAERWAPAAGGLQVSSPSFGTLVVPLEAVRWLVPLPAKAGICHDPAVRTEPVAGSDFVRTVGGDEITGTVADVKPTGFTVQQDGGRVLTLAWSDLLVAYLDNPGVARPAGRTAEVETKTGDLLVAAAPLKGDLAAGFTLTLTADKSLVARVPVAAVRAVRWRGTRCVDATALPFTSVLKPLHEPTPGSLTERFLARVRGAQVGRRPQGCPLRLGGVVYRHGFAVHSGSEVRIPLEGRFKTFEVLFGIDDEAREVSAGNGAVPGDVDARVLGDGKVLWEQKAVTGNDKPRAIGPLPVADVKELVLVVDVGGHDQTLDRATWADPLLLK
jgi:hypothetical protein